MLTDLTAEWGLNLATLLLCLLPQVGDSGSYTCVASGPSGEATWTAYLEVEGRVHYCRGHYWFTTVGFTTGSLL